MDKPICLVTGASRGLGHALALEAASRNYHVIAGVRKMPDFPASLELPDIEPIELDVTNSEHRAKAVERVGQNGGSLALLIHNAGINSSNHQFGPPETQVTFGSLTQEALLGVALTNAVAPLLFTQELADLLQRAQAAKVIAISSWFASMEENGARDYNFGYSGSKALLNSYFRLAANALRPRGVTTFMVNPGWMRTDMGGESAERTPEQSAADIFDLALKSDENLFGRFIDCNGAFHPW